MSIKNLIEGTRRNDFLKGNGTPTQTINTDGLLELSPADDIIYGYCGHDEIRGRWGNEDLYGGSGVDSLEGGDGDDILYVSPGNDARKSVRQPNRFLHLATAKYLAFECKKTLVVLRSCDLKS